MELAQTKIPYLPPDWTVARGLKYAAELGVFILVPGLHQIASKRRILGVMIFALYAVSSFVISDKPFEVDGVYSIAVWPHITIDVAQYFSWVLLVVDFGRHESRKLKFGYVLPAACVALLYLLPLHEHGDSHLHVVESNPSCEVFCLHDIVTFERPYGKYDTVSIGDLILVRSSRRHFYPARVVMARTKEPCLTDFPLDMGAKLDFYSCRDGIRDYLYDFLVEGGPEEKYITPSGRSLTPLAAALVDGIHLRKIGNTHDYFVLTERLTDFVGNVLLTIYRWTGVNLFKLSGTDEADRFEKTIWNFEPGGKLPNT